jgi:hypothetical protein
MILGILEWGSVASIAACFVLVCYVLIVTSRNPKAWVNRVVAPKLPDEPFTVRGDDITGFY